MNVRFARVAQTELRKASRYYDGQRPGLGEEFEAEVEAAIQRIQQFPESCQSLSAKSRRCVIHRFPYGIVYQLKKDHILIVAVADLRRNPDRWKDRI